MYKWMTEAYINMMICYKPCNSNQSQNTNKLHKRGLYTHQYHTHHKKASYAKSCKIDVCRNDLRDCILGNDIILVSLYVWEGGREKKKTFPNWYFKKLRRPWWKRLLNIEKVCYFVKFSCSIGIKPLLMKNIFKLHSSCILKFPTKSTMKYTCACVTSHCYPL